MKERLVELLDQVHRTHLGKEYFERLGTIADYLLANGVVVVDTNKVSAKNLPLITHIAGYPINDVIDLMEAKNAGRIEELPCKVGSTVYRVTKLFNNEIKIVEGEVFQFDITNLANEDKHRFYFAAKSDDLYLRHSSIWCNFSDFGKTVFLTREEAEKALAERSERE